MSTKPWERQWVRETVDAFKTEGVRIEVDSAGGREDEMAVTDFFLAAPDMARALLRLTQANLATGELDADEVREAQTMAEAALAKAGVSLP